MQERERALVLGAGVSGRSAAAFLQKKNWQVSLYDQNETLLKEVAANLSVHIFQDERNFDLIVASPGFPITENWRSKGKELIGEIELGARFLKTNFLNTRTIGITGTNGKTTVTLLVEHVLNHAGVKALALGNVGTPLTSHLLKSQESDTILVIELSSYQLETLQSKIFDVACILNITPDHLDRYLNMQDYAAAKINLKNCLKEDAPFYVDSRSFQNFKELFEGASCCLFDDPKSSDFFRDLESVYLKEKFNYTWPCGHDLENMLAAYALVKPFGITAVQFFEAFGSFKKPPHRVEFVRMRRGVCYYDDSKGTNVDAVLKAVGSLKGPAFLIAGGAHKGSSYSPWKEAFKGKIKALFLIGEAAKKIEADMAGEIKTYLVKTLEEAVEEATKQATAGDAVLLSPGCASFDMFKDYKARGEAFKKIVHALKE